MNKIISKIMMMLTMLVCFVMSSCSFDPKGMPEVPELAKASDVTAMVVGRTVTLNWVLPRNTRMEITGVRVSCNNQTPTKLPATATSFAMKGQPMDQELVYTVKIEYADGQNNYVSEGASVITVIPYLEAKAGFLMIANSVDELDSDDEQAAAKWFAAQKNCEYVKLSELSTLNPEIYSVLWIMVDRNGLPMGWENLPSELISDATIAALKKYSTDGGSLYLSNMATQMTVPLGIVPDTMAPTVFSSGDGGEGGDVWTINPYLGWDFRDGADQDFYDRTSHAIFKGLTLEDPNGYGYNSLPLIGPGMREDHNCLWDCNIYGKGSFNNVIKNFEVETNSLVLATWGHVRDHCVAGLVEFFSNADHGRCIANGFAAYEWNQSSGDNIYQHNIDQLTLNILNYLKE